MIFGIFGKAKRLPPLTEACIKLADFENLASFVDTQTIENSTSIDNRAIGLFAVIMGAAGHFVDDLRNPQDKVWKEVWHHLRDTNLDVITAETLVWITFLMRRLRLAEKNKDDEMFERIGSVTVPIATKLLLDMIQEQTGFDFKANWGERTKLYAEALSSTRRDEIWEAFASVVLLSSGRRSLAEQLKAISFLQEPPEWIPLAFKVKAFYSTMPKGFFESYKRMLLLWPNRFAKDDDLYD